MIKIFTSYLYSTCIATNSRLKATFFIALWTLLHGVPVTNLVAQPTKLWDKTIGSDAGDFLYSLQQTSDGGYILGGISNSNISGDKSENSKGGHDYWVVKLNTSGTKEWEKTIGGIAGDFLRDIQQTADGGYILGGYSDSNISGDKSENSKGGRDYWVVKLNTSGTKEWDKTIGGAGLDYLYSLQQTSDGGYILGGSSDSNIGGDKSENSKGGDDYWVVKLNAAGAKEWDKTYGGGIRETLKSLQQTADGGYILGGSSISNISGDKSQNSKGAEDYWVVKLNAAGTKEWDKTYGGADTDNLNSLQQTADGGYILGGSSRSNSSGDKSQISGSGFSYWVVKLNAAGTIEWEKTIGTNNFDHLYSLQQTVDGGYILGGDSNAIINGDKTENTKGVTDYWVVKLNTSGTKEWDKTIGGASLDYLYSLQQISDGGYILGGSSDSNIGGDKSENSKGGNDYWVVKLSPYTATERTIKTSSLTSPGYCVDSNEKVIVPFTTTGTFATGENFIAQLSDASGSFASPIVIGTGAKSPIEATIPGDTRPGTGYRIRVVSSLSPIVIGSDNGANIVVSSLALGQLQINGPSSPYESSTVTYSILSAPDFFNFFWTVPTGWTILNGQGTASITVSVGKQGDISVRGENFCGSSIGYYPVKPVVCSASGSILREYWANISGTSVSAIPVTTPPTATSELTSFEAPANVADNYGQRIRGYICSPATGSYTFYIAGDDDGELWLSTDSSPANKQRVAFYTGWTSTREWNKFATQKSAVITLQANTRYYIEALHKEGAGGDKLAVGWLTPGSSAIAVIPGAVLSPVTTTAINQPPTVSLTSPATGTSFTAPATITLAANAADVDGTISKVEFFHGATKLGEDATAPYNYSWAGVAAGTYSLTAKATDDKGATNTSAPVSVTVNAITAGCSASGNILREYWANISGTSVSAIPVTTPPTATSELTSFEAPSNVADNYGQRIRGYICAPATGSYTFYIAGDDDGELWLSPDDNAANKQKIAFYTGWTSTREWNKFATQKSAVVTLQANTRYYIEALHKEGAGGDKLAVGWLTPGSSAIAVIPGAVLSPVITAFAAQVISKPNREPEVNVGTGKTFRINPNPFTLKAAIEFSFDQKEDYQIMIYNVSGALVKALKAGKADASMLVTMEWADEKIPAGVYLVRLVTKNSVQTLRVVRE